MISRVMTRPLECPKGYITPELLKKVIRKQADNQSPKTSAVALEFPTSTGIIPPLDVFN
jgi:threonine aldolase